MTNTFHRNFILAFFWGGATLGGQGYLKSWDSSSDVDHATLSVFVHSFIPLFNKYYHPYWMWDTREKPMSKTKTAVLRELYSSERNNHLKKKKKQNPR